MLKRIFDFLPTEAKKMVRLTCQKWRYVLDEFGWPVSVSFRPILTGTNQSVDIKTFLNSYRAMDKVVVHACDIQMSKLPHKARRFPDVHGTVELEFGNSQATVVNFLKYGCRHANSLILQQGSLQKIRRYVISGLLRQNTIEFAHMTKLEIVVNLNKQNNSFSRFSLRVELFFRYVQTYQTQSALI